MLTLRITDQLGLIQILKVESFEIEIRCKWAGCAKLFYTVDPDQLYCQTSHKVRASQDRAIEKEAAPLTHPLNHHPV